MKLFLLSNDISKDVLNLEIVLKKIFFRLKKKKDWFLLRQTWVNKRSPPISQGKLKILKEKKRENWVRI